MFSFIYMPICLNIQFFGLESQQKVTQSYVVVIGLGGVGSHAATMLLRSGVGRLLLVDFDQVSVSSLNRHAVATREDVGTAKALCLKKHFLSIFPECHVDAKVLLYDSSSEDEILSGNPDFVLDCIDNIDTKVLLLAACVRRGLKVLSATGAGARADPTRIRVADLRESTNDPLSRAVRHRLRKDHGIDGGIPVVFSLEKPKAKLLPFTGPSGEEENPSDYQIVPGFRVRIIPVLGTIPAIFGQVMASYIVTQLASLQVQMEPVVNFDMDHYRIMHQRLIEHEELLYGTAMQVQVDVEEVMYIVKELWHGRSARDQSIKDVGRGMWRSVNELMLVRWDQTKPASVSNLILLKFKEADEHETRSLEDIKKDEPEYFARVIAVLKRAELDFGLIGGDWATICGPSLEEAAGGRRAGCWVDGPLGSWSRKGYYGPPLEVEPSGGKRAGRWIGGPLGSGPQEGASCLELCWIGAWSIGLFITKVGPAGLDTLAAKLSLSSSKSRLLKGSAAVLPCRTEVELAQAFIGRPPFIMRALGVCCCCCPPRFELKFCCIRSYTEIYPRETRNSTPWTQRFCACYLSASSPGLASLSQEDCVHLKDLKLEVDYIYFGELLLDSHSFLAGECGWPASFASGLSGDSLTWVNSFESVPDLEKSMYTDVDGYPCVRLLNLSGEIGCSNPGHGKVVAPVARLRNVNEFAKPCAVLVSVDEFESLLTRLSKDTNLASRVAGVVVESGTPNPDISKGFSPDRKFPEADFAPYNGNKFEWNPMGSGIMWQAYNFPVFLLSESGTLAFQEVAVKNENGNNIYTTGVAEFDLVMQGSVWSALPPIDTSSSEKPKPIILTVASMDSASFFRDKSLGADSPISGLITLLAAVDALSRFGGFHNLTKQVGCEILLQNYDLVFAVFTGESWGFLGSRRFLVELDEQSDAVRGLNFTMIDRVIEIGSVGKSFDQGVRKLFAHTTGVTSSTIETLAALHRAQDSLNIERVNISLASKSNPGIPPSSLMTFLKKNPQTSGIVLEDFDSAFTNNFYHSHLDNLSNINSSAIVATASLIARTLYILASDKDLNTSALTGINVNASLVEELLGCLLSCEPGLSCDLVKQYISPTTTCPGHYVGVILGEPTSSPYLGYVGDVSRFVWNFLADKTSIPSRNVSATCPKECSGSGELCIRAETDSKGICVTSSTRYVPAYSTRLKYESETWKLLPHNSADVMGAVDPVWTESNWDVIKLRVYNVQDSSYDNLILLLGIGVTVLSYLAIGIAKAFIRKALKRD
ncbi:hypothetical protein M9H77_34115 [Catharanthus roseus]|uniref:Uncharacterized protein n=1 Tax=Catharanthus roseus TaxID=4058 RepID=A0ACB9ZKK8_CATRO|nr:hypothetical protein M9H77_34115 [Catharanthus roseus]